MAVPKQWLNSMPRGGRRRVRTLTNNPTRGSENWSGFSPAGYAKRGIRRLMKVDPSVAKGTPDSQLLVGVDGVTGRSGASRGVSVTGHTESRQAAHGAGTKNIVDRSANRSLKKR